MAASTESLNYVQKMFIAFLGRAGAPDGMEYYAALIDADETSGKAILFDDLFYGDQGQALYGDATTIEIVKIIFNNVMNRDPADAGLIYWVNAINNGDFNVAEAAATIADSAAATPADLAELEAKTTAADEITAALTADPTLVAGYSTNYLVARDTLGDVTAANVGSFDGAVEANNISEGYASNTTLTTGNDTVTGADGFIDVVTGTVGTDATYGNAGTNIDVITDPGTADGDILTLTGDAGFTLNTITNIENVNVNLSDTLGGGFTIAGANLVTGGTINVDVADTVTVVGVELAGETVVTLTGALTADVSTTDVTELTATAGSAAITITGDADLATLTVDGIDANDTSIVLGAASATVTLDGDGTDTANDSAAVSAVGAVALDVNGGNLVTKLDLSGNGAAVNYTITNAAATSEYTVTGDQDVTLTGAPGMFSTTDFTDNSTGTTTVVLNAAGATDLTGWGVVSGGVTLAADLNNTLTVVSGNTVKVTSAQTNALTIDANDAATDSAITLDMDNDSVGITLTDVDTLTVDTGAADVTIGGVLDGSANDTDITIAGTAGASVTGNITGGNVTVGGVSSFTGGALLTAVGNVSITSSGAISLADELVVTNDTTMSGDSVTLEEIDVAAGSVTLTSTANDVTVTAPVDIVGGDMTVTSADDVVLGNTVIVDNDITITSDDVNAANTLDTREGDLTITVTNDVDLNGAVGVDGALTITQTATAQGEVDFAAALNVDNDVNITSGTNVVLQAGTTVNAGSLTITAQNDIDADAAAMAVTGGNISLTTLEAAGGDIDVTGFLVSATNDITMTAADTLLLGDIGNTNGNVLLTAGNDVLQDATGAMDVNLGNLTMTANGDGAVAGLLDIDAGAVVDNDVTLSGDYIDIDGAITSNAGNVSITSDNDTDIGAAVGATLGSVTITSTLGAAGAAGADVAAGTFTVSAQNDVTVSADDVTLDNVTSTGQGDVVIDASNNVQLDGTITNNGGTSGDVTVTAAGTITIANTTESVLAEDNITLSATAGGAVQLNDAAVTSDTGNITLTGGEIDGTGTITATLGSITLNSTNDSLTSTIGTLTADTDSVTVVNGTYAVTAVNTDAGGLTIAGDSSGSFGAIAAENSGVYLTTSGNVTATSIDSDVVVGSGGGDYALGTVTSSVQTFSQITTSSGDDSMTLNGEKYTVSTGAGTDTVTVTTSSAGTVVNTGEGDDVVTMTAGVGREALGTYAMGDGTSDNINLSNDGDYSGHGVWTDIEIMTVAGGGTVTLSEAQLDNDGTFEIQGGNSVISVSGVSLDASGVGFVAGNTSSFSLVGTAAADTLVGADSSDTINGGAAVDTMTGGLGNDVFEVAAADFAGTTAAAKVAEADVILDWNAGGTADSIGWDAVLTVEASVTAAAAGTANVSAGGLATFDAADDTLAEKVTAVAAAIELQTATTDGEAAFFEHAGDTYVFISDGVAGVGAGDGLIKLTGVTGLTTLTIGDGTNGADTGDGLFG